MPQLHCYLRESLAKRVQGKAQMEHLSVSRYLAHLIERDIGAQWPEDYFQLFGGWQTEINASNEQKVEIRDGKY